MGRKKTAQELNGRTFGRWTVLDDMTSNAKGERKWLCRCTCGTERYVLERSLLSGGSESCGCMRKEAAAQASSLELTGQTFGELTVLRRSEKIHPSKHGVVWVCQCSCGAEYEVQGTLLMTGRRTRCPSSVHQKKYAFTDITGQKFGQLTALFPKHDQSNQRSMIWHCRCDCGNEVDISYNYLAYCNVKSCGCMKKAHDSNLGTYLTHVAGTSMDIIRSKKLPADNTTGYRGVYLIKGKYVAKIVFQQKAYYLGSYDSIEEAAEARMEAEETLFEGLVEFYQKWERKAAEDPKWAEENPVQVFVSKNKQKRLCVTFLPEDVNTSNQSQPVHF